MKQGTMVRLKVNPGVLGSVSRVEGNRFQVTWRKWDLSDLKPSDRRRESRMKVWYPGDTKYVEVASA